MKNTALLGDHKRGKNAVIILIIKKPKLFCRTVGNKLYVTGNWQARNENYKHTTLTTTTTRKIFEMKKKVNKIYFEKYQRFVLTLRISKASGAATTFVNF